MASKTSINFEMQRRAETAIAHGSLTNSKRPTCFVKGVYPTHLSRGQGAYVWDTQGNKYIDFICGLGSSILGYANEEVNRAMAEQMTKGATLSLGTQLEVETAEKVKETLPFVDKIRFLKTGSDACSAAVRIARAYTEKRIVLSAGYHGWHDNFVSMTPPALGCLHSDNLGMRSMGSVMPADGDDIAAVIVEPVMTDFSPSRVGYLQMLRDFCDRRKALLIFDEVITGYRTPGFSVARKTGVTPDLICVGKALGNGMPISAVGGKRSVMECGEWFVSSTFAGETLSLAAAHKTMTLLQTKFKIEELWEAGGRFLSRFNEIWPEGVRIEGYPTRGVFKAMNDETKALFMQEACKSGILIGPSWFFNFSHIALADTVLGTFKDILTRIKTGSVKLEGELPVSPFAAKIREAS